MKTVLARCEVFEGLGADTLSRIAALADRQAVPAGASVFVLGQVADRLFVVLTGTVDLCIPINILGTVKNVSVESKGPGSALGWSAFVKPFRFRMSARAAEQSELAVISRAELSVLFETDPEVALRFMGRIAEITAERLLRVQALWVRELQRSVLAGSHAAADTTS